ncbi:hypothetical protein [Aquimarina sp. I32.4]|uniref:hypothetical protein n=1 Tax=Aquimarina sp. I32.4 TaxID=2053903 RepID=UPI000CDE7AE4|nr:hypothetical protein [Aquimarina sp. I32.4]
MNQKFINCFELDLAQDIPKELSYYQNHCNTLIGRNQLYKNVLIAVTSGICMYMMYKTINHYTKKKKRDS